MKLSHLREEAPILIGTQDMKDSGDDEACNKNLTGPLHYFILEESLLISSDSDHMIW